MSRAVAPSQRSSKAFRPGRLALAALAALALLTGALNVRSLFGDGDGKAWDADLAVPSAADRLVGAPMRAPTKLDGQIQALQDTLRDDPDNGRAATRLGQAYLQKARETGDPSYYPKAELLFGQAMEADAADVEAMVGQGAVALARHRFADALAWGKRARTGNAYHAAAYGVIGDAQIELGRYPEAIATFQAMVDLRPDLASFARVSYARELMGDRAGAIAAMERAATAGASSPENVAWTQAQLGNLFFDQGDLEEAEHRYRSTLSVLPDYVYGLAGVGRVAAARGDIGGAVASYTAAIQRLPAPEFVIALGDVLLVAGRSDEAAQQYALVAAMQDLYAANGVDTDLEMALFDADHGRDLPRAVARAQEGFARRPSVKAADVLAWALYQVGDYAGAQEASRQALRLGTKDALMLFHAGMIEARLGETAAAADHLQAALQLNPHFSARYAEQARDTLRELGVETSASQTHDAQGRGDSR